MHTDDVANETLDRLTQYPNTLLHRVETINSPEYATHCAKKYQYTKLNLWTLDTYQAVVHIDLDTVVLDRIDELFRCGSFCASVRHSDAFNAGVMALRPNKTIFNDMRAKMKTLKSYDGGDQGFLNSYFWQIKFAPMFDANSTEDSSTHRIQRFSSVYNYDAGMYYLSSKLLVQPKLIHFTMAFVKPWHWYGYPLFDLNWKWFENRMEVERASDRLILMDFGSVGRSVAVLSLLLVAHQLTVPLFRPMFLRLFVAWTVTFLEKQFICASIMLAGVLVGLQLTPLETLPHFAWTLFTINFSLTMALLASMYRRLRFGNSALALNSTLLLLLISSIHLVGWHLLIRIQLPGKRILAAVITLCLYTYSLYNTLKFLTFADFKTRCRWSNEKTKNGERDRLTTIIDGI